MSISKKIALFIVSIGLFGILVSTAYYMVLSQRLEIAAITERKQDLKLQVVEKFEKKFDIAVTNAVSLAQNQRLQLALDRKMTSLAQVELQNLEAIFKKYTNFKNILVQLYDADLKLFVRTWESEENQQIQSSRASLQKVVDSGDVFVGIETADAGFRIRGIAPVKMDGKLIGVLEFIQGVGSVGRDFAKIGKQFILLVNDYSIQQEPTLTKNIRIGEFAVANEKWFSDDLIAFAKTVNMDDLRSEGHLLRKDIFITYDKVDDFSGTPVGVYLIAEDANIVRNQVSRVTNQVLLFSVLLAVAILGVGAAIGFYVNRVVIKPVVRVAKYAETVQHGDFSQELHVTSSGEVQTLAGAISAMVGELKNRLGFAQGMLDSVAASFPCIVLDTNANITFVNELLLQTLGKQGNPEDYIGQNNSTFFHGEAGRETRSVKAMREQRRVSEEMPVSGPSGKILSLSVNATPLFDLDNKQLGVVTIYYDLTTIREQEDLIKENNARMKQVADQITNIVEELQRDGALLAAQAEQTNQGAETQSIRVNEMAMAMSEMHAAIQDVSDNAMEVARNAESAQSQAVFGQQSVQQVITAISRINGHTAQLKENMNFLGDKVQGIGKIITVIEDIADQTNLLALNAAIEAARAGDAGKGFAVVADEVRKLAEKTMSATKEVVGVIRSIQEETATSVAGTEAADRAVAESTELAQESGDALASIVDVVATTAERIQSIAAASEQQLSSSEEVRRASEEVNEISTQTSESMEDALRSIQSLAQQASTLHNLVQELGKE